MPFMVGTFIFWHSGRLPPMFFIPFLPFHVSCSSLTLAQTFPMAFSICRATFARRVVPLLGHLCMASSLFCPLHLCPVERVIFLAAVASFRGEHFLCVKFSLKMFLLRHATVARWDIFLSLGVFRAIFAWWLVSLWVIASFFSGLMMI
jgi:hypothetical protein